MKRKLNRGIGLLAFLGCVVVVITAVSYITIPASMVKSQVLLYEEQKENSIDIAFIGSSATYRFYDVMAIWEKYGITSMSYFASAMPFDYTITMIKYVQENQSPEIYVIDLRELVTDEYNMKYYGSYKTEQRQEAYISALNLLPMEWNRVSTVFSSAYLEQERYLQYEALLYNHESFVDNLVGSMTGSVEVEPLSYKGNSQLKFMVNDVSEEYIDLDLLEENLNYTLTEETVIRLVEVLEYCEENDMNVYFTFSPYVNARNLADQDIRRELGELVMEYGYPFTDYKSEIDEMGLDVTTEYYDANHVNAVGANKYTLYAMEDILATYPIEPDYSESVMDSWNQEYEEWMIYYEKNVIELYAKDE